MGDPAGGGQGRMAPGRRLHRYPSGAAGGACRDLLQPPRHGGATDQRRKGRDQMDAAGWHAVPSPPTPSVFRLHALACNLSNFVRRWRLPEMVEQWPLTSLREKLIEIGAKVVSHGRYVSFHWPRAPCRGRCSSISRCSSPDCGRLGNPPLRPPPEAGLLELGCHGARRDGQSRLRTGDSGDVGSND
jgi:hypothetical protein